MSAVNLLAPINEEKTTCRATKTINKMCDVKQSSKILKSPLKMKNDEKIWLLNKHMSEEDDVIISSEESDDENTIMVTPR